MGRRTKLVYPLNVPVTPVTVCTPLSPGVVAVIVPDPNPTAFQSNVSALAGKDESKAKADAVASIALLFIAGLT